MNAVSKNTLWLPILVSALGYFVDVYDIVLFSIVRITSLKSLGVTGEALTSVGMFLINIQLLGMLVGGLVWGVIGDKYGRLSVLFGSIILYSAANLANAFVTDVPSYAGLRFLAGFGLAGELGAGVTLVSEMMSQRNRGYGSMVVATAGVFGAITAGLIGDFFAWQTAYIIGAAMGFILLLLRMGVKESLLFAAIKHKNIDKGNLWVLLKSPKLLKKYISCLLVGMPMWLFVGLFMALAPEIGKAMDLQGEVSVGKALLFFNIGWGLGDIGSSLLSQYLGSRKRAVRVFLSMVAFFLAGYLSLQGASTTLFYSLCALLGFGIGYWAIFVLMVSEQFGTNFRATATVSIPNIVRALVIPCSFILMALKPQVGLLWSLGLIGFSAIGIAWVALRSLKETFSASLDFVE